MRGMPSLVTFVAAGAVSAVVTAAPQQGSLATRSTSVTSAGPRFELPALSSELRVDLFEIASMARTPIGMELLPDPSLPAGVERRRGNAVALGGQQVQTLLDLFVGAMPGYRWHEDGGIIHVFPWDLQKSFLDTTVADFEVSGVNIIEAISDVHKLLDPGFPVVSGARQNGFGPPPGSKELQTVTSARAESFSRLISVHLQSSTIRQVLDALVVAHGGGSWIVSYRSLPATYSTCEIGFGGFVGGAYLLPSRTP